MQSTNILKGFRGKRLLKQDEMATKLNISRQTYCTIENNLLQCEFDLVFKILKSMSVNEHEIKEFFNALEQDYMSYSQEE